MNAVIDTHTKFAPAAETLAAKLGAPLHLSVLLRKLRRQGVATPAQMRSLAVQRGCHHYENITPNQNPGQEKHPEPCEKISDEELAIALLSPCNAYDPMLIRIAAQLLSKPSCNTRKLLHLARTERCQPMLHYIALAGKETEPNNPFWTHLLEGMGNEIHPARLTATKAFALMPHRSRFQRVVGISNPQNPISTTSWLRATAAR